MCYMWPGPGSWQRNAFAERCSQRDPDLPGRGPLLRPTDVLAMPASVSPLGGAASYG